MVNTRCYRCYESFSSKDRLANHLRMFHFTPSLRCYLCDNLFETYEELDYHRATAVHSLSDYDEKEAPFITFNLQGTVYVLPGPPPDNDIDSDSDSDLDLFDDISDDERERRNDILMTLYLGDDTDLEQPEESEIEWFEPKKKKEVVRLYVRGTILGYRRSKSNQHPNSALVQIDGVKTKHEVTWYVGKRMAYIYKAETEKNGSLYRCIWGKVTRFHGNSGVARARFKSNLPPKSIGSRARVFMYPSNI